MAISPHRFLGILGGFLFCFVLCFTELGCGATFGLWGISLWFNLVKKKFAEQHPFEKF
jgi:hypothetical protein